MPKRRGKVKNIASSEDPSYSDDVNYTFDEDYEKSVVTKPKLEPSQIITRSRARVASLNLTMDNNLNSELLNAGGSQQINSSPSNIVEAGNLEDLTLRLERVLTCNHQMFMGELTTLKKTLTEGLQPNQRGANQTLGNYPNVHNLNPDNAPHGSNHNNDNLSFHDRSVNSDLVRNNSTINAFRIDKWNISYDGSLDINDFLFKVDTLKDRWNCGPDQIVSSFHTLLRGKAEVWFWSYLRQNPNTTYDQLKGALIRQYGRVENDCDKIVRMVERRQLPKENFDDYFTEIVTMNSKLSQPMNDSKIIDLIKNNVKESLGALLFSYDLFSLDHLRDAARKAEKFLYRQNQLRVQKKFVSEVDFEGNEGIEEENGNEVSAIKFQDVSKRGGKDVDTRHFKCWNCDQMGHSFYDCPSETRSLFCFRCGEKGVSTPKCSKHSKNKI